MLTTYTHWRFSTRAHLGSINPETVWSVDSAQPIGVIDAESRMCLSCHDNTSIIILTYNETNQQKWARYRSMNNHPIGVDYQRTALQKKPLPLSLDA